MNPMKDVVGVAETRSWLAKFKSAWAITPKTSRIKTLKSHPHLHIIGRKSTKFQMKYFGGVSETMLSLSQHGR